MPKRPLKNLTSPEAAGLFVRLLARYAEDAPDKTTIENELETIIGGDSRSRALAGRLVRNFKRIPMAQRVAQLRDLAAPATGPFPAPRFEAAVKAMPIATVIPAILADDVSRVPLPPLNPAERITLNFSGIYCSEETGDQINLVGASDEIYVVTNTVVIVNGQNVVRTETHPLGQGHYERVDTGNARLGPLAACFHGRPTDVSLVCTVMEHDKGDPDAYKDEIDLIVKSAFGVAGVLAPGTKLVAVLAAVEKLVVELINWLIDTDDDVVETTTRVIEVDELRRMARRPATLFVGQHKKVTQAFPLKIETVSETTEILHHFATNHIGGGGKYNVCFRLKVTQVGGAVLVQPVLENLVPA